MDDGCADTCKVLMAETPECFICRDVQLVDGEQLKRFCDCKNLVAHHGCLLTWGLKREDRMRCRVCNAEKNYQGDDEDNLKLQLSFCKTPPREYQQQRVAPWQAVVSKWHVWPVVVVVVVLAALVPYTVYCMWTAFNNHPPHTLFNIAAICFGILSEILLLRFLYCHVTNHFQKAQQASFSLQPRNLEEEQEAGVRGHNHKADALWQWKSRPVAEKAKQIDSQ
ncbi:uncharacterized protein LOC132885268 isoform X2 [Neoarius graeffei]|uniref:uncharacterized protein LOC132885268 isoform X2 n=1 Tax=Neoarius graeffei TaxID=443677 RepID=UPI00298C1F25|nr:uncharacterized protein LOC132885268 isoform X2 [Neoarius graeffei]